MNEHGNNFCEIWNHYYKKLLKRQAGKSLDMRILLNRTFGTAVSICARVQDISKEALNTNLDTFIQGIEPNDIAKLFCEQIKLAKSNPDNFVFGLHGFYNDLMRTICEADRYRDLAHFMMIASEQYYNLKDRFPLDLRAAYLDMVLQTTEYFKPGKLDLKINTYGISTSGKLLTGSCPYPYSDLPSMELATLTEQGKVKMSPEAATNYVMRRYRELNIPVSAPEQMEYFEQLQKVHINTACALLPLINEFTFDISPHDAAKTATAPLTSLQVSSPYSNDELLEKLKRRRSVLPSNGTTFVFVDFSGELQKVMMQEVLYRDNIYLLYRLDTNLGSYAGYYNPKSGYIYSALKEVTLREPFQNLLSLVLNLYASQVLAPDIMIPLNEILVQNGLPVTIAVCELDGPLINRYEKHTLDSNEGAKPAIELSLAPLRINAAIYHSHSHISDIDNTQVVAARYGYELNVDEVLVLPSLSKTVVCCQNFKGIDKPHIIKQLIDFC